MSLAAQVVALPEPEKQAVADAIAAEPEKARTTLAAVHSYDEVKDIMDQSERAAVYARQANDSDLIKYATEIRVRAQRKAGEMLAQTEKRTGGDAMKARSDATTEVAPPTLADMGLTKSESRSNAPTLNDTRRRARGTCRQSVASFDRFKGGASG